LDLANRKAARLNAMEEAKTCFDEAMEHLDKLPETENSRQRRISLLANQVTVFDQLFKIPEYYELLTHYEPMASALHNPEPLGAFYVGLGRCEYSFGYFDQAIQTLGRAAELAEASGNLEEAGHAYAELAWFHVYRGNYDRVFNFKELALGKMEQRFNLRWYIRALAAASRACTHLGRWDEAMELGKKALNIAEEYSNNGLISFAAWNLSIAHNWKGDLSRGIKYGELAVREAQTPYNKAFGQRGLAWAWCRTGKTNKGIELLAALLPIFRGRFMPSEIPHTCYLGEGYWLAGEYEKAKHTLEQVLEITDRCGARYYSGFAQRLLGEIALKTNPTQAASHFEKSITIFREIKAENELAMAYAGYGRLHKHQGKIAKAREYLTKALEIFERLGTLIEPDKVKEELPGLPEA
jgi:tetratricopeptide (TPR) repeat protein